MPPSKKKSTRSKLLCPSQLNNSHTDPKTVIEQLFLLRRFEDALELSYVILAELCNREEDDDRLHKNKQPVQLAYESFDPQEKIMHLQHSCKDTEICGCSAIVVLVIQIMYEMGKPTSATPFACAFYRDISCVPYDIVFVCVNLLANSLTNFVEAKRILTAVLDKNKLNQQGLVTTPSSRKAVVFTHEQREILLEFLLFHVLVPLSQVDEALVLLEEDKSLSLQKREGWTTYLNELTKTQLLKLQQATNKNNNSTYNNSCSRDDSQPQPTTESQLVRGRNAAIAYYRAAVARTRQATGGILGFLRAHATNPAARLAFGVAVFFGTVYLLAAFRRRRRTLTLTDGDDDNTNDTNTNNNNNNNRTTTSASRGGLQHNAVNNNNTKKQTTTDTQGSKMGSRKKGLQHYGGVDHIGGGFWSSVTELLSGALSLK